MPVFNPGVFLAPAIESILAQSFSQYEFIIVNDASTDGSFELLKRYAARETRIRLFSLDSNSGVAASLNRGLDAAQSNIIARMDADDVSEPDRLKTQILHLQAHPELFALGTSVSFINVNNDITSHLILPEDHYSIVNRFLAETCMVHASAMFRRTDQMRYDTTKAWTEDYDFWTRHLAFGRLANLKSCLLRVRIHNSSVPRHSQIQQNNLREAISAFVHNLIRQHQYGVLLRGYLTNIGSDNIKTIIANSLFSVARNQRLSPSVQLQCAANIRCLNIKHVAAKRAIKAIHLVCRLAGPGAGISFCTHLIASLPNRVRMRFVTPPA